MASIAAQNGHEVSAFIRQQERCDAMNSSRRNAHAKGLEHFILSDRITAVSSVEEACRGASIIVNALPAQTGPSFISENKSNIPEEAIFCSTSKGLFLDDKCLLSEAMAKAFGRPQALAVLSGPSFAKQMMENHPTAVVVASEMLCHAAMIQRAFSGPRFRIFTSQDVIGVELGGALKNPLAIGAGMLEGRGLGSNTMAAYLTRATRELQTLCVVLGGKAETVHGLSGVGDLMLTAYGDLSRNRACGMRLANGEPLKELLRDTTVEGVPTAHVALHLAHQHNVELPIFKCIAQILDDSLTLDKAIDLMMSCPLGTEEASPGES